MTVPAAPLDLTGDGPESRASAGGALVVAGDQDTAAVCQVVDLVPAADGMIVRLRLLPGLVDDYRALVERALAS
jgi:hypothetical protein